jgi:hypothetical protein
VPPATESKIGPPDSFFTFTAQDFLISQKFFELLASGIFARVRFRSGCPLPPRKIKILAEIARVFFCHRFGPPVAALMGGARIVTGAI